MRGIRDGPGTGKVAGGAAFFAGIIRTVSGRKKQSVQMQEEKCGFEKVREKLLWMSVDEDEELSQETIAALQVQIDEMLHAPMLIWKSGVLYQSWAQCLSNKIMDDSRGDAEVSPFLVEENA